MVAADFAQRAAVWAAARDDIQALVQIGSQVRAGTDPTAADVSSDWDFQVICSRPAVFEREAALAGLGPSAPKVFCVRDTFGGVKRLTALYPGAEVDLVLLPAAKLKLARLGVRLGGHRRPGPLRRGMADLAIVIRPGYRFLKGERGWGSFYARVLREVTDPRLSDDEARALARAFVCDLVWVRRKLARGELLAAQRTLHQSLAETNFRLLHEARLRRGGPSQPEARRVERLAEPDEVTAVTISARVDADELQWAADRAQLALERLMVELIPGWRWPE